MFRENEIIFRFEGGAHFEISRRGQKPVVIINKNNVEVDESVIIVGDYAIGYL